MSATLLLLGLIGFGVYTENAVFYWLAGTVGVVNVFFQLAIAGFMKSVSSELKKTHGETPLRIKSRRRY